MTNQTFIPKLWEALNFSQELVEKRLFFNVFSYLTFVSLIIMGKIFNVYWGWKLVPWLLAVLLFAWILGNVEPNMFSKEYFIKKMDKWLTHQKSNLRKENFVMGMYFCVGHGLPGIKFEKDRSLIRDHLVKNYVHLMDLEFILSNVKLIRDCVLSDIDNEFNKIVSDYVFKNIQEHEKYRIEKERRHNVAEELIREYPDWFNNSSIPREHREFYEQILK